MSSVELSFTVSTDDDKDTLNEEKRLLFGLGRATRSGRNACLGWAVRVCPIIACLLLLTDQENEVVQQKSDNNIPPRAIANKKLEAIITADCFA